MIKNCFDSHPYPAGTNRLNAQVGLLTHPACRAFPVYYQWQRMQQTKTLLVKSRDTQQQELFRIRTGFPFHPSAGNATSWLLVHCKCM